MTISRRHFVKHGPLWVATFAAFGELGCTRDQPAARPMPMPAPMPMPYGPGPPLSRPAAPSAPSEIGACGETDVNIEGPYYRAGAPLRADLAEASFKGTRIAIRGRILGPDCVTPVPGALLDLWQADADGRYDNDGHMGPTPGPLTLRGKQLAAADGSYAFHSILPGHYLNGPQYRPAHVHAKVTAPGYRPLTTQLYFDGDPYNKIDPFIRPRLIMKLSEARGAEGVKEASFDFVLARG